MGRAFCETLMDYADDNPTKVNRFLRRVKKIRRRERKARKKAAKLKKLAEGCIVVEGDDPVVGRIVEKSV